MEKDIVHALRNFVPEFDARLDRYLSAADAPPELLESVRYSALAPGKRIRPFLVIECCKLVGGQLDDAWPAAAAIECIHAFSLVHDDLPALDNDDLRRGRPTTHKKFGEAMAILAGDALLTLAFELIAKHVSNPTQVKTMTLELARGTGWAGMIGGQAQDILSEKSPPSLELVRSIHERKTGSLFAAACRLGAIAAGADSTWVSALGRFGGHLGCAFQIADDLLDVTATSVELGKTSRKDAGAGKQTYPACVGVEASRDQMERSIEAAVYELRNVSGDTAGLISMARYVGSRKF